MPGTPQPPVVSVVTPTFRRPARVERLLDALGRQTMPSDQFEVIVVDDCSGDATMPRLEARVASSPFRLRLLQTPANGGPAVARNLGWRAAGAPLIAFIDDDCVPDPEWLEAGVRSLGAEPSVGVVQGCTQRPPDTDWDSLGRLVDFRLIEGPTPRFEGCNIFYRREALAATGGFDEDIAWWGEDTAAGWRVVSAGWGRGYAAGAVAVHDVEVRPLTTFLRHSYLERNVVRLAAEHPRFRHEYFWRSWAVTRGDAAFVLAAVSVMGAAKWRPLVVGVLPYLWLRRPSRHDPQPAVAMLATVTLDAARTAGHLVGAIRHRVFVI